MDIRQELEAAAESSLARFSGSLIPGSAPILGVRYPVLRKIARRIVRGDWQTYLATATEQTHEETLLQAFVLLAAPCTPEELTRRMARFVPKIHDWAVCDAFSRRLTPRERDVVWQFLQPYFHSEKEFEVRFALNVTLQNFIDEEHLDAVFRLVDSIRLDAYYTRMGIAWLVSVCYVEFPERTSAWLDMCRLDDWTFNKSLSKITESRRVSPDEKLRIKARKRK